MRGRPEGNATTGIPDRIVETANYDWEGDKLLNLPMADSSIDQVSADEFTPPPNPGVMKGGDLGGVIHKVPYFESLGVTAIEPPPNIEFADKELIRMVGGKPLNDYRGYSTMSNEGLHLARGGNGGPMQHQDDVRGLVKGGPCMPGAIASRISGICYIYEHSDHPRIDNIHVANRHDGFTLNDLVGCKGRHEAKGEENPHCILNSGREELPFDLPPIEGQAAYRVVDTGMESPNDVVDPGQETAAADNTIIARKSKRSGAYFQVESWERI